MWIWNWTLYTTIDFIITGVWSIYGTYVRVLEENDLIENVSQHTTCCIILTCGKTHDLPTQRFPASDNRNEKDGYHEVRKRGSKLGLPREIKALFSFFFLLPKQNSFSLRRSLMKPSVFSLGRSERVCAEVDEWMQWCRPGQTQFSSAVISWKTRAFFLCLLSFPSLFARVL